MSRLLVLTSPSLVHGFYLAGVEAVGAASAAEAQQVTLTWLDAGETGLLAIDEVLLAGFDPTVRQRLEAATQLPHLALPSGEAAEAEVSARKHIADLIRRAVGFHLTFRGEPEP
jgi:vacuolar-type H+-ATPase subunit F/Vma7